MEQGATMLLGLGIVVVTAVGVVYVLLLSAAHRLRLAWQMEAIVRVERTRSQFAEARAAMMQLVFEGKLDIESHTFRTFYGLQTFIMRRPEAYNEFSRYLVATMLASPSHAKRQRWMDEVEQWHPDMAAVMDRMSRGVSMLAFEFPYGRRLIATALLRLTPVLAAHASKKALRLASNWFGRVPIIETTRRLLAVQSKLETISRSLSMTGGQQPSFA